MEMLKKFSSKQLANGMELLNLSIMKHKALFHLPAAILEAYK